MLHGPLNVKVQLAASHYTNCATPLYKKPS